MCFVIFVIFFYIRYWSAAEPDFRFIAEVLRSLTLLLCAQEEPFTTLTQDQVFNIARFLITQLPDDTPLNISRFVTPAPR